MENKARGNFIAFFIGLLVGWWPVRFLQTALTFGLGFLAGNTYNLIKWFIIHTQ